MTKSHSNEVQVVVDALGLRCPLPILRFKKRTAAVTQGSIVEFITDDPTGEADLRSLCEVAGHEVISKTAGADGALHYLVRL